MSEKKTTSGQNIFQETLEGPENWHIKYSIEGGRVYEQSGFRTLKAALREIKILESQHRLVTICNIELSNKRA